MYPITFKDNLSYLLLVVTCIFPPLASPFDGSTLGQGQLPLRFEVIPITTP